ncbi:MAG: 50S ribosomal protein L28, partial [Eubacteriales bacterium]|nr:50S ribosomal protein L28 [Eubacteriales bacterium]
VHKVKVVNKDGTTTSEYVCTRCLRSGKVERA